MVKSCNLTHELLSFHNYSLLQAVPELNQILNMPENDVLQFVRVFILVRQ